MDVHLPQGIDRQEALRASVRLYVDLADPLLERHGVPRADRARAAVLAALEAGLHWRPPDR